MPESRKKYGPWYLDGLSSLFGQYDHGSASVSKPALSIAFLSGSAIVLLIMVVRMRHTRAHTANRRSHHALTAPTLGTCSNCSAKHRPHHMCQGCGFYKGRMVIDMKAKTEARDARIKAKEERRKGEQAPEEENATAIPGETTDVPLEKVATAKSKEVQAPELAQAKKATPRKGQAA